MVASAVMASAAVAAVASTSVASAATARVYELAVETFCEFLFSSLADCEDLASEVEGLACHLVVDVDLHYVLENLKNGSWSHAAHLVYEWDNCSNYHKVVSHLAVDHEG